MSAVTFKALLYPAMAVCLILFGSVGARTATHQALIQGEQAAANDWEAKSLAELEPNTAAETQQASKYEACARGIREDYSDDPERAERWIRTLCHQ